MEDSWWTPPSAMNWRTAAADGSEDTGARCGKWSGERIEGSSALYELGEG